MHRAAVSEVTQSTRINRFSALNVPTGGSKEPSITLPEALETGLPEVLENTPVLGSTDTDRFPGVDLRI